MAKTIRMQPDKFKQIIRKQDEPERPATLGEPTNVTDWIMHMQNGHKIKTFTKIQTTGKDKNGRDIKQAFVNQPLPGQRFIAEKETFCGHYYIWIICIQEGSDRIIFRVNSGDMDFVDWDVPSENKKDTK